MPAEESILVAECISSLRTTDRSPNTPISRPINVCLSMVSNQFDLRRYGHPWPVITSGH
jgi:hypothetical protein